MDLEISVPTIGVSGSVALMRDVFESAFSVEPFHGFAIGSRYDLEVAFADAEEEEEGVGGFVSVFRRMQDVGLHLDDEFEPSIFNLARIHECTIKRH